MASDGDSTRTCSLDEFALDDPSPGDYVEIDGEPAVVETIVGGRARVNTGVRATHDDANVDTCSVDDIDRPSPTPGDFVTVDGERAVVEEILGGRARVNFSVE
ncbi:hypothetical protein [Halorussus halobius]|uniref:hypothetical protein n=1 Tax=Halorussus halobius TaxID=1710537 RepID=UPI001092858E|nr:hypothetical protein [Halorussus halobius]